jgi:uncharacterized protein (TIGR02996 family)
MSQETAFLDAIRCSPGDDATRLVYADWLDEQGDKESARKSSYIRLECRLAEIAADSDEYVKLLNQRHETAQNLPRRWLVIVTKVKIENCPFSLESKCPKCWDRLLPATSTSLRFGDELSVRFCEACKENVFYCTSITQAKGHMQSGSCVALDPGVPRQEGDLSRLIPARGFHPTARTPF